MPAIGNSSIRKNRLEFFSDAVLAVAITLMVLRINPPNIPAGQSEWQSFSNDVLPIIVYYLITFAVIVRLWRRHHDIFWALPNRVAPYQVTLNMMFLASVCLLPFGLEYYHSTKPVSMFSTAIYTVSMVVAIILLGVLGASVTREIPWQALSMSFIFLLAIPLVPWLGSWAIIVWVLTWPVGRWWDRHDNAADG